MNLKIRTKKVISFLLSCVMILSIGAFKFEVQAAETTTFPDYYPADKLESISEADIKVKVDALILEMTDDEKYVMLGGSDPSASLLGDGTGFLIGVPRLGVPAIRMWDGPKGVDGNGKDITTSPSSEVSLAASFDTDLAYKYGVLSGRDNKGLAGNVQLGVQLDNVRGPFFARSRDSLGEDPYLTGILGSQLSKGVESQNVMSTLKHLAVYSQMPTGRDDMLIDEQTLHDLYLAPYERIIKDGNASAVMSSYNMVNSVYTASNEYLQKDVLRNMWGFQGLTMSDWSGNKVLSTQLGTDLEMKTISKNSKTALIDAYPNTEERMEIVDTAVRHVLTAMGQIGYLGLVVVNEDGTLPEEVDRTIAIELPVLELGDEKTQMLMDNDEIALESALKGGVLLKNENDALPIKSDETVASIGFTGEHSLVGHDTESAFGWLESMTSPNENLKGILGADKVETAVGIDLIGETVPSVYLYQELPGEPEDALIQEIEYIELDGGIANPENEDMEAQNILGEISDNSIVEGIKQKQTLIALDESEPAHGVKYELKDETDGVVASGTKDTLDFKTGTRTFKNGDGGDAFSGKGNVVNVTTYLKAPKTGSYKFKLLGIGGAAIQGAQDGQVGKITVGEATTTIPYNGSTGGRGNTSGGLTNWPRGGLVCTDEGMAVPGEVIVDLVQDKYYKIEVNANITSDAKDLQLRLTWFPPEKETENLNYALELASSKDKVVVFVHDLGAGSTGVANFSRVNIDLAADQKAMLTDVLAKAKEAGKKTIVVLYTGLPVTMNDWISDADAILEMWLPGQAGGKATAQLLTGVANPSGKLPITFPKNADDTQYGDPSNAGKGESNSISEGIFAGYRHYDKNGIAPLFDFGHGLSYTTFTYSDLSIARTAGIDYGYDVTFTVTNSGSVSGDEVAQVYLGKPSTLPEGIQFAEYQLAGFQRTGVLEPDASKTITIKVDEQSLSYWDKDAQLKERSDGTKDKRVLASGQRNIVVGTSSDDFRLARKVTVLPIAPSAPTVSPDPAVSYTDKVRVSLTAKEGDIYYTTDGTNPSSTNAAQKYTAPFDVSSTTTIKAIAVKDGVSSSVVSFVYTIDVLPVVPSAPTASPDPTLSYTKKVTVSLSAQEGDIYYTTNGTNPSSSNAAQKYTAPFDVSSTTTIKAIAVKDGVSSDVVSFVYTINSGGGSSGGSGGGISPDTSKPVEPEKKTEEVTKNDNSDGTIQAPSLGVKNELSKKFSDASSIPSWAENAIAELVSKGILAGRTNGTFDSSGKVTRAEFITMSVNTFRFTLGSSIVSFKDVSNNAWYKNNVDIAASNGIVSGIGNELFAPDQNISRQDLCVILLNALKKSNTKLPDITNHDFSDDSSIAGYAKEAVYTFKLLEIVNGRTDGKFDPSAPATRAESAVIIKGVLDYLNQ